MSTSMPNYEVSGRITRRDTNQGIHGLRVEAWKKKPCNDNCDCLGSDFTNRDGSFRIILDKAHFEEKCQANPDIFLKVRDCEGRVIYDTCSDVCTYFPGKPWVFNLSLVPDILWWHLACAGSWKCPEDPLLPEKVIDEIEEAIEAIHQPGKPGYLAHIKARYYATPPIQVFDHVLRDACHTLQGDLDAAGRYRDFLEAICSYRVSSCCCGAQGEYTRIIDLTFAEEWSQSPPAKTPCQDEVSESCAPRPEPCGCPTSDGKPECPCQESLISPEKVAVLIMAAMHIACRHETTAKKYLLAILDQICRFEMLGALHRAAVKALCGDEKSRAHFRDLMEFIGTKFNPDDAKLPTFPAQNPLCCCETCLNEEMARCIREIVRAWRVIKCYRVDEVKPARACPGEEIVICGEGFGKQPGQIVFREKGGLDPGPVVEPVKWCDNQIVVVVPEKAGCGLTPLLPADTVRVCDRYLEFQPTGCVKKNFEGTSAEILKFSVKGRFDGQCIEPGEPLLIRWKTCAADKVKVEIINEATGAIIAQLNPAAPRGKWDFTATHFTSTIRLKVQITVEGKCKPPQTVRHFSFIFQKQPNLTVDGMEVTQAIQYYRAALHLTDPADRGPDNSLRLVTNKTAWVRAYLRSGQDPAFDNGRVTGVNGTLTVERRVGGVWGVVANIPSQNGPVTAEDSFVSYDAERGNINNSLNFVVPANLMTGLLRFRVNVFSEFHPCPGNSATGRTIVDVNLRQTLNAAFITIGYNGPNATGTGMLNLPAPTLAQCQAETGWTMRTYPVSGNPNVRVAASFITNTPLNDPRSCPGCCSPNWGPLLTQIANLIAIDQAANPGGNWVYYGLINNGIPVNVPGCNGAASGGLAGNQNGITYAHEIGHQFGLPHARCGGGGAGNAAYPIYEPYDLPVDVPATPINTTVWTMASIGEYGLDINNGNIANPNNAEDFMSYCGPRWISIFTYNFLVNRPALVPQVIPTGSGAATDRVIQDEQNTFVRRTDIVEPLIQILGSVNKEGAVEVHSVAHFETVYFVGNGQQTGYVAQLVDDTNKVIAQDYLYRYEDLGCGGGDTDGTHDCCEECKQKKSFAFKAMLKAEAPGAYLQIVKDGEVVWQRRRPSKPLELTSVSAELDKENNLKLSWKFTKDAEAKEDVWIRWSNNDGETWKPLTVGLRGTSAILNLNHLPSGDLKFQVLAHDGFATASKITNAVKLPPRPFAVSILYPTERDRVYAETFIHLWGTATRLEGEAFADNQFVWYIDGKEVGKGGDIWVENPGVGQHEVRLEVHDSGEVVSAVSIIKIQ